MRASAALSTFVLGTLDAALSDCRGFWMGAAGPPSLHSCSAVLCLCCVAGTAVHVLRVDKCRADEYVHVLAGLSSKKKVLAWATHFKKCRGKVGLWSAGERQLHSDTQDEWSHDQDSL